MMNQTVTVELYSYSGRTRRRIAVLPHASDELVEELKRLYPRPRYWVRLVCTLFDDDNNMFRNEVPVHEMP